jgi:hypothetical protein
VLSIQCGCDQLCLSAYRDAAPFTLRREGVRARQPFLLLRRCQCVRQI